MLTTKKSTQNSGRLLRESKDGWKFRALHWRPDVTFNQDRTQCSNADYIKGRTVLNKMAFKLLSKMQNLEVQRSGQQAPSKPMLKAGFSNPEALITTMAQRFSAEK